DPAFGLNRSVCFEHPYVSGVLEDPVEHRGDGNTRSLVGARGALLKQGTETRNQLLKSCNCRVSPHREKLFRTHPVDTREVADALTSGELLNLPRRTLSNASCGNVEDSHQTHRVFRAAGKPKIRNDIPNFRTLIETETADDDVLPATAAQGLFNRS